MSVETSRVLMQGSLGYAGICECGVHWDYDCYHTAVTRNMSTTYPADVPCEADAYYLTEALLG